MIYYLISRKSPLAIQAKLFLGIYYLTSMAFYVNLCFSIPNFSSQDFRYIAYLVIIEAVFIGLYLADQKERRVHVWIKRFLLVFTGCFVISAGMVYLLLGLIQN